MRIPTTFTVTFNPDPDAARAKNYREYYYVYRYWNYYYLNIKSDYRVDKIEQKTEIANLAIKRESDDKRCDR